MQCQQRHCFRLIAFELFKDASVVADVGKTGSYCYAIGALPDLRYEFVVSKITAKELPKHGFCRSLLALSDLCSIFSASIGPPFLDYEAPSPNCRSFVWEAFWSGSTRMLQAGTLPATAAAACAAE